jgi:chemotaxis protein MotA
MDKLTLVGLVVAIGAIIAGQWLEGGNIGSLLQLAAAMIVLGGTIGAVMLQSPFKTFALGVRLARWVVSPPSNDPHATIARIVEWAQVTRQDGMLALENRLADIEPGFVRNGVQMLVDGFDADKMRQALEVEIGAYEERMRAGARIWEAAGGYAPTIGILGAVLGLIHVMENLADPSKLGSGIAVAFVATVYGVGAANLILLPVANKLKGLIEAQIALRELVLDGLLGIAHGENPKLIEARLAGHLA